MPDDRISQIEIDQQLSQLPLWTCQDGKIYKEFVFRNFIEAFDFMGKVAELAEQVNHHPNWTNIYNKVEISLITHEYNCISQRDFNLAKKIDQL